MLKNIDFNKNRQRWKNYFCLFISFLFLIFFYVNRTTILENDPEFSSKFKIASIVLGWIVGVVLIFVRLDFGKKWNRVINILYILFAPCYIFFNMEIAVFNETYSFRGQHLSLLLFNFLLIGILELIFIVITNRVRLGTDIWAFICVMFNIVNHFVYEFRGTPAMASDIATVGTALEVADGYKIQFNFYTTVALVMLFDFIMLGRVIKCEPVFKKVSHRLCGIAVMAIVSVTGFSQLVMTDMVSNRGLYLSLFNPMRSYQQYGSIACFTRSIKLSVPEKPNGYSLKKVEEMVEVHYNSGQFANTMEHLVKEFPSPFDLYVELGEYYEKNGLFGINHSRLARYENLWQFIRTQIPDRADSYREWLTLDLYLRENVKNRPAFAGENQVTKEEMTAFYREETETHRYLKEYDGFDARQLRKMTHLEKIDGKYLLFDYRNRSRLSQNAATYEVCFSNE